LSFINEERLVEQFLELVKIDSETKHEGKIANYLKDKFLSLGLKVEEDNAKETTGFGANNLICTLDGNSHTGDGIFFSAHMDTVVPGKNIKPMIKDGYITSDGTTILGADDKAAIAIMIEIIHILKEQNANYGNVQFLISVGEESGLVGAKAIDTSLIKAKHGYVVDSDGEVGNIVVQAPYQMKIFTEIFGKSAHAGVALEKGISAINVAAKAISKLKLGRIDKETTANIGYFKGGKETNIVCDYVEVLAEARSLQKDKVTKVVNEFKQTFDQVAKSNEATASVDITEVYPGFQLDKTDVVVSKAIEAAEICHLKPTLLKSGGGSDANIFNGFGFPTANLAVGYENIHTKKERIAIKNMVDLTEFVFKIIQLHVN